MKGFLLVVSGPSGVGKGTVLKNIINQENIVMSISATTRGARNHEKNNIDYFFKTEDEFKKMIDNGELLEYANVHNHFYGTPKQFVFDKISDGKIVILEIDVQGAFQVKKNYKDVVTVFIDAPSFDELKNRIVGRNTEDEMTINLRLENAKKELREKDKYDYIIINDDVNRCADELREIIKREIDRRDVNDKSII